MRANLFLCLIGLLVCSFAKAVNVNRLNGGANVLYVDFSIPGPVIPLELIRTYNSITAVNEAVGWNGAFGWGWTAVFETTLTVTPEKTVLLRDGGTGNTIVFRSEKEDPKVKEQFFDNMKRAYFERQLTRKLSDSELKKLKLPDNILSRLKTDPQFRLELASKFNVKGDVPKGELLVSSEFGYQTLIFKDNAFIREKDGITQYFDREGRLVRSRDKNGAFIDYKYSPTQKFQVRSISSQDRLAELKFVWKGDRIIEVTDNRNRKAKYRFDGAGNLVESIDGNKVTHKYSYENKKLVHLITRVDYLSEGDANNKVFREIHYDDAGLVTYHREKDGTEFNFTYGKRPSDPDNNFWTKMVKHAKGQTEEFYDEYFIKSRSDGSKYLYKQESKSPTATTITLFTPCCGKPLQITKNGEVTTFKYYDNGLLAERVGPKDEVKYEYEPAFKKVTRAVMNGVESRYDYDARGNLVKATNTKNQTISLKYDRFGRISDMIEPSGRLISFKYGDMGKPVVINEKGVGTLKIDYDREGRIVKAETAAITKGNRRPSEAESQDVVRRIMQGFQSLLDILKPAGVNLSPV